MSSTTTPESCARDKGVIAGHRDVSRIPGQRGVASHLHEAG